MEIDKNLPALTPVELQELDQRVRGRGNLSTEVVTRLLNDLLRKEQMCRIYYSGLGPADGDFRQEAMGRCFSKSLLIQMGELEDDEEA